MTPVRILLVDDHPIVRAGVRSLFDRRDDAEVVGEAASGEEAVVLARHLRPDVVLCDLRLGAGMDGVQTTAALRALDPAPAVLILTTFDRDAQILGAIEAGAAGYLLKDIDPEDIVRAVRQAAAGGQALTPELTARVGRALRAPRVQLTGRELDVLRLLDTGASNREIAKALFVTEATVKTHLVHVFEKLGADSRAKAVAIARESGLL
ncbi:response regulator transcription factor [Microbacterium sp. NRRL B-14842]|uniref:response regulator n=1 Tax=unclassified Microbacterium TaxID=2609290 RepID=UPI002469A762|nr:MULTISPECIES: response regulator transcription factor [unclassified Microbacterium]MDH5132514.1 response regulator transcription factor [Microbacterium sp. RD10]MDH5136380.1 response regulator transcription factor [Microbacterium sp. RD11]MDH5145846.1 response regulator transcription factor [Microbacterium sp. RD12]MDH5155704.1 response regulator transcription factor [Microbacterium sp. RD06]MDH5166818.1 response regulator transcription factor [Microbacterium sp. RD02]